MALRLHERHAERQGDETKGQGFTRAETRRGGRRETLEGPTGPLWIYRGRGGRSVVYPTNNLRPKFSGPVFQQELSAATPNAGRLTAWNYTPRGAG